MANGKMANFLATDKVPETIFGIPVVSKREDYTEADLAFFRDHPEAGGYYDMGDGEDTPEDGTPEGAPVQADVPLLFAMSVGQVGAANYRKETGKSLGDLDAFNLGVKGLGTLSAVDLAGGDTSAGRALKSIRKITGWQYGPGDSVVYETDSDPAVRKSFLASHRIDANTTKEKNEAFAALFGNTQTTAGEILDLDSSGLSYMYPTLAGMKVKFAPQPTDGERKNWKGSFSFASEVPEITVYPRGHNSSEQIRSTVLHEIQHYIQHVEGWAPGWNVKAAGNFENYLRASGEIQSRATEARRNLTPAQRKESLVWSSADRNADQQIDLRKRKKGAK